MGLELKITDKCNLNCDYCYYHDGKSHEDMSFHDILKIIEYFKDFVIPQDTPAYDITFFGGEPLLKKDLILEVVDHYLKQTDSAIRLRFHLCTNGVLLSTDLLKEFQQRSIGIYLSLDGPQDLHDTHRHFKDGSGSFATISQNLEKIADFHRGIEQVISVQTVHGLFDSFLFFVEEGFRNIISIPDFSDHWTPESLEILKRQYKKILEYKKKDPRSYFSILDDKIRLMDQSLTYKDCSCNFGQHSYVVATNGLIYPCTRFAQDIADNQWSIGDIHRGIDFSKRDGLISKHKQDRKECSSCAIKNICLGNCCACISFSLYRTFDYVSPLVCEHERMVFDLIQDYYTTT